MPSSWLTASPAAPSWTSSPAGRGCTWPNCWRTACPDSGCGGVPPGPGGGPDVGKERGGDPRVSGRRRVEPIGGEHRRIAAEGQTDLVGDVRHRGAGALRDGRLTL